MIVLYFIIIIIGFNIVFFKNFVYDGLVKLGKNCSIGE